MAKKKCKKQGYFLYVRGPDAPAYGQLMIERNCWNSKKTKDGKYCHSYGPVSTKAQAKKWMKELLKQDREFGCGTG